MDKKIETIEDFKYWVQIQLAVKRTSQKKIAEQLNVASPRLSEAVNGHPSGRKYIAPMVECLGGNVEDFKAIM